MNKSLEELFSNYNPTLKDEVKFMSVLERKLDAVEYIRQYQEAQRKQNRIAMLIVFIAGLMLGTAAMAVVLSLPADFALNIFGMESAVYMWVGQYFHYITIVPLSILVCYMIFGVLNLWQETRGNLVLVRKNIGDED